MAQYKCIPAPKNIKGNVDSACSALSDLMNKEAASGWKYHSMESFTVTEPSGCLSFLTGNTVTVSYNLLTFVRE